MTKEEYIIKLSEVLSTIVEEEYCCYDCDLCKVTGVNNACEHPEDVLEILEAL